MNTVFTVEESNLIGVFLEEGAVMGNREKVMEGIQNALPHLDDEDMIELSGRVLEKLKNMTDEELAGLSVEMAE